MKQIDFMKVSNKNNNLSKKTGKPAETAATTDGIVKLKVTLEYGDGRYTKGLFNKKRMVNFKLKIEIENLNGLKIKSITACLKGKGKQIKKVLPTTLESITEFDLPIDTFGGNIEATINAVYKIGIFKTKQLKATISKQF